jgi:hypothetical protein
MQIWLDMIFVFCPWGIASPYEDNACVNWVGYDIVNVSIDIVQLDDMKSNLGMRVLHKTKIIW